MRGKSATIAPLKQANELVDSPKARKCLTAEDAERPTSQPRGRG